MTRKEHIDQADIETRAYTVAQEASVQASKLVLPYWPHPLNPDFDAAKVMEIFDKNEGIGNYATIADMESEKYIIGKIRGEALFADHGIIAEESGTTAEKGRWQWCIDPVDGTLNFRNGLPDFSILIGILKDHEPTIGMLTMPAYQLYISARIGHGAILSSFDGTWKKDLAQLPHLQTQSMDKTLIGFDVAYEGRSQQYKEFAAKVADQVGYTVSYASIGAAMFRLAQGSLGGYFVTCPLKRWDIAAASVIIPEIGGVVSDINGHSIDWSKPSSSFVAARTPQIHQHLLEMLHAA